MKRLFFVVAFFVAIIPAMSQNPVYGNAGRNFQADANMYYLLRGTDTLYRISKVLGYKFFTSVSLTDDSIPLVTSSGVNKYLLYDSVTGKIQAINESNLPAGIQSINSQTQSAQTISVGNGMSVSSGAGTHTISIQTTFITSGRYTPTLTGVTNVAGTTTHECTYFRVGNAVTVSGIIEIDPTAASTLTELRVQLPITASVDFATIYECSGAGNAISAQGSSGGFTADTTNEEAFFSFVTATDANQSISFSFTYFITPL